MPLVPLDTQTMLYLLGVVYLLMSGLVWMILRPHHEATAIGLWCGGGVIIGAFFDQRLVDKVTLVIAPLIVGAESAPAAVAGIGASRMRDAVRLRDMTVDRLGDDILVTGYPEWPENSAYGAPPA